MLLPATHIHFQYTFPSSLNFSPLQFPKSKTRFHIRCSTPEIQTRTCRSPPPLNESPRSSTASASSNPLPPPLKFTFCSRMISRSSAWGTPSSRARACRWNRCRSQGPVSRRWARARWGGRRNCRQRSRGGGKNWCRPWWSWASRTHRFGTWPS